MAATKIIFLSCLVAVLGCLAYRELQVVTFGYLLDPIYIPAKRSDVFRLLLEPELSVKIHPLCTGVSNVVRSQDAEGRRIVEFDIQERAVLLGLYDTGNFTFHVALKVSEEDVSTELKAELWGILGLVQIKQGFDLKDAENGKDGTMLVDYFYHTARRVFARVTISEAYAAHTAITHNIRQHFVEMSKNAKL